MFMIYPQGFVQTHVQAHSYFKLLENDAVKQLTAFLSAPFRSKAIAVLMASIYITHWEFQVFTNKTEVLNASEVF